MDGVPTFLHGIKKLKINDLVFCKKNIFTPLEKKVSDCGKMWEIELHLWREQWDEGVHCRK